MTNNVVLRNGSIAEWPEWINISAFKSNECQRTGKRGYNCWDFQGITCFLQSSKIQLPHKSIWLMVSASIRHARLSSIPEKHNGYLSLWLSLKNTGHMATRFQCPERAVSIPRAITDYICCIFRGRVPVNKEQIECGQGTRERKWGPHEQPGRPKLVSGPVCNDAF